MSSAKKSAPVTKPQKVSQGQGKADDGVRAVPDSPNSSNSPNSLGTSGSQVTSDMPNSPNSLNAESPTQVLPVVLLDDATGWSTRQVEILALAEAFKVQGHAVHVACPASSPLAQKALEQEFSVLPLSFSFSNRVGLLWRFKRKTPLLVYAFSAVAASFARAWAAWRAPHATLCVQDVKELPPQEKTRLSAQLATWKSFHKCIFPCALMSKIWVDAGLANAHAHAIAPALDASTWGTMPPALPPQPQKRALFLVHTSLCHEGGLPTVLKAMEQLLEWEQEKQLGPSFEVRVVGSGQDFESLLTQARGLGVEERLALLGEQDLADVLPLVHGLILPQQNSHEVCVAWGQPPVGTGSMTTVHALLAAWTLSIPVMCTDVAPYNEWSQGHMLTFAPDDAKALAEHMWQCSQNTDFWHKHSENSAKMRHEALMSRFQKDHMSLHKEILEQRGWGFLCKK